MLNVIEQVNQYANHAACLNIPAF